MAEMTTTLLAPLVGSFNKPPAPTVLKHLPSGAPLIIEPEPENPYDPRALKVLVDPASLPESRFAALEVELPLQGATLEQVMSGGPLWLGYVAASGGKPLAKAAQATGLPLVGNAEIIGAIANAQAANASWRAELRFGPDAKPLLALIAEEEA